MLFLQMFFAIAAIKFLKSFFIDLLQIKAPRRKICQRQFGEMPLHQFGKKHSLLWKAKHLGNFEHLRDVFWYIFSPQHLMDQFTMRLKFGICNITCKVQIFFLKQKYCYFIMRSSPGEDNFWSFAEKRQTKSNSNVLSGMQKF